jgi:uncharacterized protein YndB with AHSA1/START domain
MNTSTGTVTKTHEGFTVEFERILQHDIHRVWDAISNTEKLAQWFTDFEFTLKPGSKMKIFFRDAEKTESYGEILRVEPPNRFAFTWEDELAEFDLVKIDDKTTRLHLKYSRLDEQFAATAPAGFHFLLDRLSAMLAGDVTYFAFGATEDEPGQKQLMEYYGQIVYAQFPELERHKPVIVERIYHAPVERVWQAITDPKLMKQWYFDIPDFKAQTGNEFHFYGKGSKGEEYLHICRIYEIIPLQKLSHSWEYEDVQGQSLVTFELEPQGDKTKLKLTHRGLGTFPEDRADFARKSFNDGWTEILGTHLKNFLEKS